MRILIVQFDTPGQAFQGEDFLRQVYPEAERLYASNQADMIQALEQETIDLLLLDGGENWKHSSDVLQLIHNRQPGLPVVLLYPGSPANRVGLEPELEYSRIGMDMLLNTSPYIILFVDPQRKILVANRTFYQRSGKRPEEVIGRALFDVLPPDQASKHAAVLRQVLETGKTVRFEAEGADGWQDYTFHPIVDDLNQVVYVAIFERDITERKRLEEELRRDQRIMLASTNAPGNIFVVLDRAGTILLTNELMARSFDRQVSELIGQCFWDLLPKPAAEFRRAIFNKVLSTGIPERAEDNGRFGTYDSWVVPITDDQGKIIQIAIIARDITDRKRAELSLKASEERYRTLVETSPDGIIYYDLTDNQASRMGIVNQRFAEMFGYENPEEIINLQLEESDLIAEQDRPRLRKVIEAGLEQGYIRDVTMTARRKDGSEFQLEANGSMVCDPNGKPVGFLGICRDITERKRSELALKASEERYRTLVETSPDGIAFQDLNGHLLLVNQGFAVLFGYSSPEEIYNLNINGADLIAEQDPVRRQEIIHEAWQNMSMQNASFKARRKDGTVFQLEVNGSVIYDPEGKPIGIITICRDVTERYHMQEELVRARQNLEQRVIERTAELQAINRQLHKEVFLRKQAEEQWQRQALHAGALAQVAARANAQLGLKAVLDAICTEVIRAIPYPVSSISLHHEEDDCLHIEGYATGVTINRYDVPPTPRVVLEEYLRQSGSIIVIPDVANLPNANFFTTRTIPEIRTLITLPLYHQGEILGTLNVVSVGEIRIPSTNELDLLFAISDQAVLSIANARLFERVSEGQANLKMLTERLVEVQEAERRYLARELHDEIGQNLTSLSLNLELITRSIEAGEKRSTIQMEMESIRGQVKELLNQVRDLSLNLLPAMLDDLGLLPTLLDHCQRFTAQTGIRVELVHHGFERRLPAHLETAAYRIIQEALTNVARYARVDRVDVRLWATPYLLGFQVEDEGAGFDLQLVESSRRSSGLSGMRERAANCGGTLEIETTPGLGTCLTAEFPLDHRKPMREVS